MGELKALPKFLSWIRGSTARQGKEREREGRKEKRGGAKARRRNKFLVMAFKTNDALSEVVLRFGSKRRT